MLENRQKERLEKLMKLEVEQNMNQIYSNKMSNIQAVRELNKKEMKL